jgi:hypothetical protein
MKTKRLTMMVTLFAFLMQTLFPPALFSMKTSTHVSSGAASLSSMDYMFDQGTPDQEKYLISEYIQFVINSIPYHQKLSQTSEKLSQTLANDEVWYGLKIDSPGLSDILDEANLGRQYIVEKATPAEVDLHERQKNWKIKSFQITA